MGNKLTSTERDADVCPDCHGDSHETTCRRMAMAHAGRADLQCGPPWNDWPEGLDPVNPLAKA